MVRCIVKLHKNMVAHHPVKSGAECSVLHAGLAFENPPSIELHQVLRTFDVQTIVNMDDSNNPIPPPAKTGDFSEKSISSNKPADGASPQGQKRKWEPKNKRQQQGAKRHKGRDMGRQEYKYVVSFFI